MRFSFLFFLNSILFGVGLAIDAFSVSVADALNEPHMKRSRMCLIAGTFGFFQIIMPLIGWLCVHTVATEFTQFQKFIPWIALALLLFLGIKMIVESVRDGRAERDGSFDRSVRKVPFGALILQGIATSIDALSVGFTISEYSWYFAMTEALIIGVITFGLCMIGLVFGKTIGKRIKGRIGIIGGVILIAIGIEIFLTGIL